MEAALRSAVLEASKCVVLLAARVQSLLCELVAELIPYLHHSQVVIALRKIVLLGL